MEIRRLRARAYMYIHASVTTCMNATHEITLCFVWECVLVYVRLTRQAHRLGHVILDGGICGLLESCLESKQGRRMQAVIPEAVTLYIPRRVAAAVRRSRESRKLHGILVTKRIVVGVVSTLGIELSDGPHTIDSG
jgi:hypothetical protein